MRLDTSETNRRLSDHDHGILCTVHPDRGTDAVPVVYAAVDRHVGIPIDRVKPKAAVQLQRERNLDADPRATLLIEHWNRDDWSQLWWVRAELVFQPESTPLAERLATSLATRFDQYSDQPFHRLLVLRIEAVTGWSARP